MLPRLLILNYHRLLGPGACRHNSFDVRTEQFLLQLNTLKELKVNFISLENKQLSSDRLNVALTFDDGMLSDLVHAAPALISHKIPASFFIPPQSPKLELDWKQVRELSNMGFTIGSHSLTHKSLTALSAEERFFEMRESRRILEQEISKPVSLLAFPFGQYNKGCLLGARLAGYTAVFSSRFDYNITSDGYIFHRWSVKHNTTIQEFENVINGRSITVLGKKTRSLASYFAGKIKPAPFKQSFTMLNTGNI